VSPSSGFSHVGIRWTRSQVVFRRWHCSAKLVESVVQILLYILVQLAKSSKSVSRNPCFRRISCSAPLQPVPGASLNLADAYYKSQGVSCDSSGDACYAFWGVSDSSFSLLPLSGSVGLGPESFAIGAIILGVACQRRDETIIRFALAWIAPSTFARTTVSHTTLSRTTIIGRGGPPSQRVASSGFVLVSFLVPHRRSP
jgi:hypothetical protein